MSSHSSDSEQDDLVSPSEPPQINPYSVLSLEKSATPDQIKTAYRKAALKNHPDKVSPEDRDAAKTRFQEIAFAYAILSDPVRRKRYDTTGSTAESLAGSDDFSWHDFFSAQYADVITEESIARFAAQYKGSDEEKDDVLAAYEKFRGDMGKVYSVVMLSDVVKDDERFRSIIDVAIEKGEVEKYRKYSTETRATREARVKAAKREAKEADEYAKELGLHEKLRGKGGKNGGEAGLAALIRQNQASRGNMFDKIAEKYGAKPKAKAPAKGKGKGKSGSSGSATKKRRATDLDEDVWDDGNDIPDDEFEAIQAKMMKNKKAKKT